MTYPFWVWEDRWAARGLLLAVVALNLGIVYINVPLNKWNNTFYDALQDKNYQPVGIQPALAHISQTNHSKISERNGSLQPTIDRSICVSSGSSHESHA